MQERKLIKEEMVKKEEESLRPQNML
jgi:hypothetical protein